MMIVMTVLAVWAWTTVSYPSPNSIPAVRTPVRLEIPILQRALRPPPLTDSVPDPSKGPVPSLPSPTPIMPAATPVISEVPASFPPLSLYAAALSPEQNTMLDGLSHLPRYEIEVELVPPLQALRGTASVAVLNSSSSTWTMLVFRLPANLPKLGADMQVHSIHVNGQLASPIESGNSTVLTIPLQAPLSPGNWIQVDLEWRLQYASFNNLYHYVRLGRNQDMLNLPYFYPELAVFSPGAPGTNPEGWWIAEPQGNADLRFHEATLMHVTTTTPDDLVVVGSGHLMDTVPLEDGRSRYQWITGPVRGFVLQASPIYLMSTQEANGVTLRSYYHAEDEAVAKHALAYARNALLTFEELWGPYPYSDFTIVSSPLIDTGLEYSNLIQIGVLRYRNLSNDTTFLIIHEVAHQWWYLLVHNDPVHFPSLDEGIAELAYVFYLEENDAEIGRIGMIHFWRSQLRNFEALYSGDVPWWRAGPYQNPEHYYWAHYRRPAVLMGDIWASAGDVAFNAALRDFIEKHRFQIVTPEDWEFEFKKVVTGDQLIDLQEAWQVPASPPP